MHESFGNKSLDGQCRFADWDVQILAAGETAWDSKRLRQPPPGIAPPTGALIKHLNVNVRGLQGMLMN
jgi:hypothetical protein